MDYDNECSVHGPFEGQLCVSCAEIPPDRYCSLHGAFHGMTCVACLDLAKGAYKLSECPSYASLRARIEDTEGMAMLLYALVCAPLGTISLEEHWGPVNESVRELWCEHARALSAWLLGKE